MVGAITMALGLGGCTTGPAPEPTGPSAGPTSPAPTETAQAPPELVPNGSATDNLPYFEHIVREVWATPERSQGRAYIDALVEAGFHKRDMQVTRDRTTLGDAADSILFSVAWDAEECLIGQVGPSTGEPVVAVMAQISFGRCLIGETRPINW